MTRTPGVLLTCLTTALLCGCGGGGGGGSASTPPPANGNGSGTGITVSGRILDATSDAGIAGASVSIASSRQAPYRASRAPAETDADGFYALEDVQPGQATMSVSMPEGSVYESLEVALEVSGDRPAASVFLRLKRRNSSGPGSITLSASADTVVVGSTIQFTVAPNSDTQPSYFLQGTIGTIDLNGVFTALRPGTGQVKAYVGSMWASRDITVTSPSTSVTLTGTIAGTVRDGSTGDAIGEATVAVADKTSQTDASGAFSVGGVTAGTHTLMIEKTGFAAAATQVTVPFGGTLNVGALHLRPAGSTPPPGPAL